MSARFGDTAALRPPSQFARLWLLLVALVILALAMVISGSAARIGLFLESPRDATPLEALLNQNDFAAADIETLRTFYAARDYAAVWTGPNGIAGHDEAVFATLTNARDEGLDPDHYHAAALAELRTLDDTDASARYELLMTDGLLRYARDVRLGRMPPNAVDRDIHLPPQEFDAPNALLASLAENRLDRFLADLPPPHPEYARLRVMLKEYRVYAETAQWESVPEGLNLETASDEDLARLHLRLAADDIRLTEAGLPDSREELLSALRQYQRRNGLEPDGILGPMTLSMLNASPAHRLAQIAVNMERWRWLPRQFEQRYVMVNAADATLVAVDGDATALHSRVIIGAVATRTPMLRADAVSVTVNPPWNVPRSIAVNEMLPRLRSDPAYLRDRDIVLVNGPPGDPYGLAIDWNGVTRADFPYTLRQSPGPDAALGFLKLEMPSPYSVYLHDTPSRALFARATRTLSHGCIRVEEIKPLASWVLTGDTQSALERIEEEISRGETVSLPASEPVAVYVLYWTAGQNEDGTMGFRPDAYRRDARLIAALGLASDQISG